MPLNLLLLTVTVVAVTYGGEVKREPMVDTPSGTVRGTYMAGYQTDEFEAFMGIPYGMPPIGKLRFSNPKAYRKWRDVLNATQPRADCIQKNYLLPTPVISGSEDCLYLNVYRPKGTELRARPLPVMVYMHGGGWFSGTASPSIHGPEYFMDTKKVILVTIAYRLGPFGFLSTNDTNMPGNFGLKDQNLALRWVQRHIKAFNGDHKRVTIFGQSAGAVSVHLHMLSKQSAGLFHNVIAMSGTANVPFAITRQPLDQTRNLARYCNITNATILSTVKLSQALRSLDAVTILNAADEFKYWNVDNMVNFRAVVENRERDAFLTEDPANLLAKGQFTPVPLMLSGVPQEGAVRVVSILENATLRTEFNHRFDYLLQKLLEFPARFNATEKHVKTQAVIDEYFKGQHELNAETAQGFLATVTDRGFHYPLYNTTVSYVKTYNTRTQPLYLYMFKHKGPFSFTTLYTDAAKPRDYGVVHCDDLIYLFRSPLLFPDFAKNSTEAAVIRQYVGNFVEFAGTGKPLYPTSPCNLQSFNRNTNAICDNWSFADAQPNMFVLETENQFNVERMQFWRDLLKA